MRILIATVTAGAGHLQAAAAIEEAWRRESPDDTVETVDLLDFVPRLHRKVYLQTYLRLVKHAPDVWGMVFKKTDNPRLLRKLSRFRRALALRTNPKFGKHLLEFAPDVVIATHFAPLEIVGQLNARKKWTPPLTVCVVTDFEAHALWLEDCVDVYCVAAPETKARLVAYGRAAENVLVTGIPIASKFSFKPDPGAIRKQLGLRDDLPIVLVLGGGFGMGPVGEILAQLDQVKRPLQTIVVAGRNEELRRELAAQDHRHPTRVLGFAGNMHELMAVADLIVSKPGGLTSSEALALGRPLLILNPIPGQEAANSDYLLQHGAAAKVTRVEDLPFCLEQLVGTKKGRELARAAKALGRPRAAVDICAEVRVRLARKPSGN